MEVILAPPTAIIRLKLILHSKLKSKLVSEVVFWVVGHHSNVGHNNESWEWDKFVDSLIIILISWRTVASDFTLSMNSVMVNVMGQLNWPQVPRSNLVSGCVCAGVPGWDWIWIGGLSRWPSPVQVGISLPAEGLSRTRSRGREDSSCPLSWDAGLLLPLDWDSDHRLPWVSGLHVWAELHYHLSWVSTCRRQTVGLLSLCNCVNQSFILNPFIYIYLLLVLFLWRTMMSTNIHIIPLFTGSELWKACCFSLVTVLLGTEVPSSISNLWMWQQQEEPWLSSLSLQRVRNRSSSLLLPSLSWAGKELPSQAPAEWLPRRGKERNAFEWSSTLTGERAAPYSELPRSGGNAALQTERAVNLTLDPIPISLWGLIIKHGLSLCKSTCHF